MTTISTVGYGSEVYGEVGKICMVMFISVVIVYVPEECSRLMDLVNSKSVYARRSYKTINQIEHIVLIGTVSQTSLMNFLEEYFHEDHGEYPRHCVLMMPTRPDQATEIILMRPNFATTLFYIEGSSLDPIDLGRCFVERANAVIILSDKFSFDAEHEDTHTILEAMIIKDYIQKKEISKFEQCNTFVCMQLLRPESIIHYELSLNKEEIKNDQIICIE
jgi:hypothetical protein